VTAVAGNRQVDNLFRNARNWRQEADALREILLECDLAEEVKWGKPCYTHDGKNICIIQRMKDFLALLFFKGALLNDPDDILEVQGPNSRAGYRMRFTSVDDVTRLAGSIKSYVREAIEVELAGLAVKRQSSLEFPDELVASFQDDPDFESSFEALTPGRKRGYILHFTDAKKSKTRFARIEKSRRKILEGKGIHD
jgi:uncharacterized protein YdeI (YjbR/CyaY-like superfamily)